MKPRKRIPQQIRMNTKIRRKERDKKSTPNSVNIVEVITKGLAAIAGVASLVYVLGFAIVNIHLASFGIFAFSLGRARYISAGILFSLVHMLISSIAFFAWPLAIPLLLPKLDGFFTKNPSVWRVMARDETKLRLVLGILIIIVIIILSSEPSSDLFLGPLVIFEVLFFMSFTGWYLRLTQVMTLVPTFEIGAFVGLLLITLIAWSSGVYPNISSAYGGGAPVKVQLVISDAKNANLFTEIGFDVKNGVTSPVDLLDNSGDTLIVLLSDDKGEKYAVELEKSLVANIVYLSKRKITPTPSTTAPFTYVTVTPTPP